MWGKNKQHNTTKNPKKQVGMNTKMLKYSNLFKNLPLCYCSKLFSGLDVTLWRAFPSELCFSESSNRWGANPLLGLDVWLYHVVFGVSHALFPLLEEGCHRLMCQLFFYVTRPAQALDKSRPCELDLWSFMKLHVVFGSSRAGEAVWLMLLNSAVIQSSSTSVCYKLQTFVARLSCLQEYTYVSTN